MHVERRRGTREEAREYCRKEESRVDGPWEKGDFGLGGQGKRSDLVSYYEYIRSNPAVDDKTLLDNYPAVYLKYPHAADLIRRINCPSERVIPRVHLFVGPPGSGKSRMAFESFLGAYWKSADEWWSDYDGRSDIVLDDFYGWLPLHFMLRLLDRYPLRLNCKGSHAMCNASNICITTNKLPTAWYSEEVKKKHDIQALVRRFNRVVCFAEDGSYDVYESQQDVKWFFENTMDVL